MLGWIGWAKSGEVDVEGGEREYMYHDTAINVSQAAALCCGWVGGFKNKPGDAGFSLTGFEQRCRVMRAEFKGASQKMNGCEKPNLKEWKRAKSTTDSRAQRRPVGQGSPTLVASATVHRALCA